MRYMRFLCIALVVLFCGSCSTSRLTTNDTKYVYKTDTLYQSSVQRDSIYYRDSVFTYVKGDTLIIKEYHDRVHDIGTSDTVYMHKVDTVTINQLKTVEIEKTQSWWEKLKNALLYWSEGLATGLFLMLLLYLYLRKKV